MWSIPASSADRLPDTSLAEQPSLTPAKRPADCTIEADLSAKSQRLDISAGSSSARPQPLPLPKTSLSEDVAMSDSEDESETSRPRIPWKDKGKAKVKPMPQLPEEVWKRVFELYYDQCADDWGTSGKIKGGLLPLLISPTHARVAASILYSHPHIGSGAIGSFMRCVKYPSRCSDVTTKIPLVKHLTIRPTPIMPEYEKIIVERGKPEIVNPLFPNLTAMFPHVNSFTLKDTLVTCQEDATCIFAGLSNIAPTKARIEIRMWDLYDSAIGPDLIAATRPNVYAVPQPRSAASATDSASDIPIELPSSEPMSTFWTIPSQQAWRDSIISGLDLHLPSEWLDPRHLTNQADPQGNAAPPNNIVPLGLQNRPTNNFTSRTLRNPAQAGMTIPTGTRLGLRPTEATTVTGQGDSSLASGSAIMQGSTQDSISDSRGDSQHTIIDLRDTDDGDDRSDHTHATADDDDVASVSSAELAQTLMAEDDLHGRLKDANARLTRARRQADEARRQATSCLESLNALRQHRGSDADDTAIADMQLRAASLSQVAQVSEAAEQEVYDELQNLQGLMQPRTLPTLDPVNAQLSTASTATALTTASTGTPSVSQEVPNASSSLSNGPSTGAQTLHPSDDISHSPPVGSTEQSGQQAGSSGSPALVQASATASTSIANGIAPPNRISAGVSQSNTTFRHSAPPASPMQPGLPGVDAPSTSTRGSATTASDLHGLTYAQRRKIDHIYFPPTYEDRPSVAGPSGAESDDGNRVTANFRMQPGIRTGPDTAPIRLTASVRQGRGASYTLAHQMRSALRDLIQDRWGYTLKAFSFVAFDPLASLVVRAPNLDFWVNVPVEHIRVHMPRGVNSLAIFKDPKQNEKDRLRARRDAMTPNANTSRDVGDEHSMDLTTLPDANMPDDDDQVVGGDGLGGGLVHPLNRLFEIEVNTVRDMRDDTWTQAGSQLPPQVCRILLGEQDWSEVSAGRKRYSTSEVNEPDDFPSPKTADYASPAYSLTSLDSSEDDGDKFDDYKLDAENDPSCYDAEAAKRQAERMAARRSLKHEDQA